MPGDNLPSPPLLAVYVVLGLLAFWQGLRWFERANLFIPDRTLTAHPGTFGLAYEDLSLTASDGAVIHGWFVEKEKDSPVILFSHGNAGNISNRLDKLIILREAGASVLLYDYRGFGRSSGVPTEEGTYRDAEAAYRYLTEERGIAPERIILYGESLGCAVAVETALRLPAGGLILESGFSSVAAMGRMIFPFLPVEHMVRFRYDNLVKIETIRLPLMVMHSPGDDIVPFAMGRSLFEAAPEPKSFFEMRGSHNDGFIESGPAYGRAIEDFISSLRKIPQKES